MYMCRLYMRHVIKDACWRCTHTNKHAHTHTRTHTHAHTHAHISMSTRVYVCMQIIHETRDQGRLLALHTHTNKHAHTHAHTRTHAHTHQHEYTHARTHAHINMSTRVYVCMCVCRLYMRPVIKGSTCHLPLLHHALWSGIGAQQGHATYAPPSTW